MAVLCDACGTKLRKNSSFCHKCGKEIEQLPEVLPSNKKCATLSVGRIIGLTVSISLILIPVVMVVYLLLTEGFEFGKYDLDSLFPDFNGIMSGRKTPFQKQLKLITNKSAIAAVAIALPSFIIYGVWRSIKKYEDESLLSDVYFGTLINLLCVSTYMILGWLLVLFDFNGTNRIVAFVSFCILAVLCLVLAIISAKNCSADVAFLFIAIMLTGNLFGILIAPFIGWALLFFNKIFWIVLVILCVLPGGATYKVIID